MYFWRINDLKRRLAAKPLSDRETLPYVVAWNAVLAISAMPPPYAYSRWDVINGLAGLCLAIWGTVWIYRRNGGSSGRDFVQRVLAIGWVVNVRVTALVVPVILIFNLYSVSPQNAGGLTWYGAVILIGFQLVLLARVGKHIADIAQTGAATETTDSAGTEAG